MKNQTKAKKSLTVTLEPEDNQRLLNLCGQYNQHLNQIEKYLDVEIQNRGNEFTILGQEKALKKAALAIQTLFDLTLTDKHLTPAKLHLFLQAINANELTSESKTEFEKTSIRTKKILITPHSVNQNNYINNILKYDINFGVGPAGTGKTFLAVACAVAALEKEQVERIILVRPAVEAGEKLGFLPGDIAQKIDPYLRPLYDALYETLGAKTVERLLAENIIEIAPLAFMRGRTLNSAFIILDESQNTTIEQMKMFLTRMGFGSKAVITGDITQIDLAKHQLSGMIHALTILKNEPGIGFNFFEAYDVVRHPLVQRIVTAYERAQKKCK
ncbi:MAG: PhoH family protein [Gammaproteobacteria bacterium]|nr:PhoH family protein [Gammaproteobacteria bacterium]